MSKSAFERMSVDELTYYNSLDVRLTSKCWERCQGDLAKEAHVYSWAKRAAVLGQTMQLNGIAVDQGFRRELSADLKKQCDGLLGEMRALTGVPTFNPYKAADLRFVLFKQFGAPILKATKKGFSSTDKAVLTAIAAQDTEAGKLARLVQEFRYVNNVRVRCVDNLEMEADGRIHASWRSFGTISWRFACRKPNLQNFNRMKGGLDPRGLFVAKPGYVFVYFDVGQAEMRFAAYLSQDAQFIAEVEDIDVYTARARALFRNIPQALDALSEVDDEGKPKSVTGKRFRHLAKTSSLAANYMISADNLWVKLKAEGMNVDYRTVVRVLDKIRNDYETYFEYVDSNVRLCQKVGFLQDPIIGLKRRLGFYPPPSDCANFPIQSGIGAITVQRLHEIQSRLDPDCLMVLQVHDSCAVETPEHKAESVVKIVRDVWSEEVVLSNGRRFLLPIDLKCGTRLSEFS